MRAEERKGFLKEGTTRDPGLTPRGALTRDSTTHTVSNTPPGDICQERSRIPHITFYHPMIPEACVSNVSRSSGLVNMSARFSLVLTYFTAILPSATHSCNLR